MLRTIPAFMNAGVPLRVGWTVNESLVTRARDSLARDFMQTGCTHLMFIDADIGFRPEDILKMAESDKDIIAGLYPRKEIDWGMVAAAVRRGVPDGELHLHTGALVVNTWAGEQPIEALHPGDDPVEVESVGTGFMLIKREVLEVVAGGVATYLNGRDAALYHQFFTTSINSDGILLSEDFYFCELARRYGFKVWVAPWAQLTHTGAYRFGRG